MSPAAAYGRQIIEDDDIAAVVEALKADLLTTGPRVARFEAVLARTVGSNYAVACSNGTAALYMAARALGLESGATVVVPAITFAATASGPHLAGADIVFSDVDPETGLMRAQDLEEALTRAPRARAVIPVHYAGQSCDMESIARVARPRGMRIIEDAAHAIGTRWLPDRGKPVAVGAGAHSDCTTFSFHPVKTIAMGEGGAVTANDPELHRRLLLLRNHGIERDPGGFSAEGAFTGAGDPDPWHYEVVSPSFNFRVSDINCALGLSQLGKLSAFVARRAMLASVYDEMLAPFADIVRPLKRDPRSATAWHIYPVRIDFAAAGHSRASVMHTLARGGIGSQVHYIPVHKHPYYARRYPTPVLPSAEIFFAQTLTLPLHAGMDEGDAARAVAILRLALGL